MDNELNNREEHLVEMLLRCLENGDAEALRGDKELREDLRQLHDVEFALRDGKSRPVDVERELQKTLSRLSVSQDETDEEAPRKPARRLVYGMLGGVGIGIAATLLILFSLGFFSTRHNSMPEDGTVVLYSASTDKPGPIIFGHREKSDNLPDDEDTFISAPVNTVVSDDAADAEILDMRLHQAVTSEECIVTTPVGKTMEIILDDGTDVLLSPESSLRFPARFSGDKRTVKLDGEAYFAVAKDSAHPFIVMSGDFSTTALGTEFDVRAYDCADLKVSLIEGSVRVENLADHSEVILNPGEDVTAIDGKMVVSSVDMKAFRFWRDGYFYFEDAPLADMMTELGRWHNVNVVLGSRSLMSYRLHFVSGRNEDISDVVNRLNKFSYLDVKLDGNKIVIEESKPREP